MLNWLHRVARRYGFLDIWDLLMNANIFVFIVLLITARFAPDFVEKVFNAPIYFNVPGLIAIFTLGVFISIKLRQFRISSSPERARRDQVAQFRSEQAEIRLKIIAATSEEEKEKLWDQAEELELRQEVLLNDNLRRYDGTFVTDWRESLLVTRKRLLDEEQRLLARNRLNLLIGIIMALVGVALPMYYIFRGELNASGNFGAFVASYWPFFTIVVIIEIIAIFFLSLYSSTERRLERNKSDLTNIELRLTSGLMLYEKANKDKFAILADNISKEDSKFVLGKNESSGGIDPSKLLEIIKATK